MAGNADGRRFRMCKHRIHVLDVGTGPGPSAFAAHGYTFPGQPGSVHGDEEWDIDSTQWFYASLGRRHRRRRIYCRAWTPISGTVCCTDSRTPVHEGRRASAKKLAATSRLHFITIDGGGFIDARSCAVDRVVIQD